MTLTGTLIKIYNEELPKYHYSDEIKDDRMCGDIASGERT
jgi:hypothetical protein